MRANDFGFLLEGIILNGLLNINKFVSKMFWVEFTHDDFVFMGMLTNTMDGAANKGKLTECILTFK